MVPQRSSGPAQDLGSPAGVSSGHTVTDRWRHLMATGTYRDDAATTEACRPFSGRSFSARSTTTCSRSSSRCSRSRAAGRRRRRATLSLVGAIFILPFLLFSGYAGAARRRLQQAHACSSSRRSLEIVAMALGLVALLSGHLGFTYVVLFLMALQATFFSPAKYGILPEMLPDRDLSRANGLLEMSTFVAIVLGTAVGGAAARRVAAIGRGYIGVVAHGVAVAGTVTSLRHSARARRAHGRPRSRSNPLGEIWRGIRRICAATATLWLTTIGISYFWFLGSLLQLSLLPVRHAGAARSTESRVELAPDARWRSASAPAASRPAGCRATRSSSASRRSASIGMGVFACCSSRSATRSRWRAVDAGAGRLLRRPVRRAAQRAAAAAARRRRKGPHAGDQQLPEHGRDPAGVGRAVAAAATCCSLIGRPRSCSSPAS